MLKTIILTISILSVFAFDSTAQTAKPVQSPLPTTTKKINQRPVTVKTEPFEKATVENMAAQCVKLETKVGVIELEMFPESAPETVRSFLNLAATGLFNTTKFTRIVPSFVVQGGNLSSREEKTPEISLRARQTLPDEPSAI